MSAGPTNSDLSSVLAALANGIIPRDERDDGACGASCWSRIVAKVESPVYRQGLDAAQRLAQNKFGSEATKLSPAQVHELLGLLREEAPGFFKQLRMDVSAAYLGDPAVWQRVGFPGPSIASGGYADFDQPQTSTMNELKEPSR